MSDWGKGSENNNIGWGQAAGSATNDWGKSQKNSYAGQTDIVGLIALSISYSANNYCDDSGNTPQPTVSNNTGSGTFSSTTGLIIDTNTGVINTDTSTAGSYVITYTDTDSATATFSLAINDLDNAGFSYSASSFEPTGADPTPTITGLTGGTFSGTTGLVINSTTGEIDLSASTVASHTITYNTSSSGSSVCPNTSTQTVEIAAAGIANNYSMAFDGTNDYIETSSNVGISGSQSRTISVWLKGGTSNNNKSWPMAVAFGQGSTNKAMWIGGGGGPNSSAYWYFGWWGTDLDSNVRMDADNDWHLLTSTYDGTTAKGYIDGVEVVSGARTINTTDSTLLIGKHLTDSIYWQGSIDEVAVWNTALTSTQVSEIYNGTGTNLTKDLSTVAGGPVYWNRMGDN